MRLRNRHRNISEPVHGLEIEQRVAIRLHAVQCLVPHFKLTGALGLISLDRAPCACHGVSGVV